MEDLMQLSDELFGGDAGIGHNDVVVDDLVGDEQAWQQECDGGSPDDQACSYEDVFSLAGLGEQGAGGHNDVVVDDLVGDEQAWQQECDSGSPDDQACSYDDVFSPAGSGEQGAGGKPSRDDSDLSGTRKRRDRSKTSRNRSRCTQKQRRMDKASIIADAVEYVRNLQSHARKLKEDVAALEARPGHPGRRQHQQQKDRPVAGRRQGQHGRNGEKDDEGNSSRGGGGVGSGARVTHVCAVQVGEGWFFVTVECEQRGGGVAAPLCTAVESLDCFRIESSNIGCESERVVSSLTLKVSEAREDVIGERTVKLWMMAALLIREQRSKEGMGGSRILKDELNNKYVPIRKSTCCYRTELQLLNCSFSGLF